MTIKKTLQISGVAVATLGLSTCSDGGAVDPAPPPLDCTSVGDGESLSATGTLLGQSLTITVSNSASGTWSGTPTVTSTSGGQITGTSLVGANEVQISIGVDISTSSGSFTLSGTLKSWNGTPSCAVTRTFNYTISGNSVVVAIEDRALPLGARDRAAILIHRREGREVELRAGGVAPGGAVGWTATGGAVEVHEHDRVTWKLPEEPGLYQMELLVDRGREGLSLDTLTLEVG